MNTHEGLRVSVSKGINLGTQVSHMYCFGGPQPPVYQYRVVLVQDDRVMNAATDLDFNQVTLDAHGAVTVPFAQSAGVKLEAVSVAQHKVHNLVMRAHAQGETSSTQLTVSRLSAEGDRLALSHMQSLSPQVALGGE